MMHRSLAFKSMGRLVIVAAFLLSATAATAGSEPSELIAYETEPANTVRLHSGTAKFYGEARRQLARGEPQAALKSLRKSRASIFADREALLSGDAYLALGKLKSAESSYRAAIKKAQVQSVVIRAARGLIEVYAQQKQYEKELAYVDALLGIKRIARRSGLLLRQARLRMIKKQYKEAGDSVRTLLVDYPSSQAALHAEPLVRRLKRRKISVTEVASGLDLGRVHNLIRSRSFARAEKALNDLDKKKPKLKLRTALMRAQLYKKQRKRREEKDLLLDVHAGKLGKMGHKADDVTYRIGRLSMQLDEDDDALRFFGELDRKYPDAKDNDEAQFYAGWVQYNRGKYSDAYERLMAFAERFEKSKRRTEGLWYAGFSAYLGGSDGKARTAWERLIQDHPRSDLIPQVYYWTGRALQRQKRSEEAAKSFVSAFEHAPLSYYGFMGAARLKEMGQRTVFDPPPELEGPAKPQDVLARLGAGRPLNLDRAIILHQARLSDDALDELNEAERTLSRVRDTQGRTLVADLLATLGAHNMAFKVGLRITRSQRELTGGTPWAWRAWRHAYPRAYEKAVTSAEASHDVDRHLVWSIMRTESHYKANVRSHAGARGLMQLMPKTARRIGIKAEQGKRHAARYREPESNVWLGSWYIKQLLGRYGDQLWAAIGAYNAGPGAMDKWLRAYDGLPLDEFVERIPWRETRRYTRRVLETMMVYRRLYGGDFPMLLAEVKNKKPAKGSVKF